MNRVTPFTSLDNKKPQSRRSPPDQKGIHDIRSLPDAEFDGMWDSIILPAGIKDRLLSQAVVNFTARAKLQQAFLPFHGIILLVGPPGAAISSPSAASTTCWRI